MNDFNICAFPLHIWDRELDARILSSAVLASAGATCVLGHEYNISPLYNIYSAIFHFGAGRPIEDPLRCPHWYAPIVERNGHVGLTFEEGINDAISTHEISSYSGITSFSLKNCSMVYAWSSLDKSQIIEACPLDLREQLSRKISVSSSARIEMLGAIGKAYFASRTNALRILFGDYTLISDNFGGLNVFGIGAPLDPSGAAPSSIRDNPEALAKLRAQDAALCGESELIRARFAAVINQLVLENPHELFILRPHPVADPTYWERTLTPARNLVIIYRDSVWPWIFASSSVIHSGCTVGMEAELANIPAINIKAICQDTRPDAISTLSSRYQPQSFADLNAILRDVRLGRKRRRSIDAPPMTGYSNLGELLRGNLETIDFSSIGFIGPYADELKSLSSLAVIAQDSATHFSNRIGAASRSPSNNEIVQLASSLGSQPPLPSKSRYYSYNDIRSRLNSAIRVLGLPHRLTLAHVPAANTFIVYRQI